MGDTLMVVTCVFKKNKDCLRMIIDSLPPDSKQTFHMIDVDVADDLSRWKSLCEVNAQMLWREFR